MVYVCMVHLVELFPYQTDTKKRLLIKDTKHSYIFYSLKLFPQMSLYLR